MSQKSPRDHELTDLLDLMYQAHPWHGVSPGADAPDKVTAYIELVPSDTVKYEVDKRTGHLKIDRPQRYSSVCPTPYGFVPQTYCGESVAARCAERVGRTGIQGDGDPLDICIITEKQLSHGNVLLSARPIGGLRMVDKNEADDKIIAVLDGDFVFDHITDLDTAPKGLIERLRHYFLSYKQLPNELDRRVDIAEVYGRDEALEVVRRSVQDYRAKFGAPEERAQRLRTLVIGDGNGG